MSFTHNIQNDEEIARRLQEAEDRELALRLASGTVQHQSYRDVKHEHVTKSSKVETKAIRSGKAKSTALVKNKEALDAMYNDMRRNADAQKLSQSVSLRYDQYRTIAPDSKKHEVNPFVKIDSKEIEEHQKVILADLLIRTPELLNNSRNILAIKQLVNRASLRGTAYCIDTLTNTMGRFLSQNMFDTILALSDETANRVAKCLQLCRVPVTQELFQLLIVNESNLIFVAAVLNAIPSASQAQPTINHVIENAVHLYPVLTIVPVSYITQSTLDALLEIIREDATYLEVIVEGISQLGVDRLTPETFTMILTRREESKAFLPTREQMKAFASAAKKTSPDDNNSKFTDDRLLTTDHVRKPSVAIFHKLVGQHSELLTKGVIDELRYLRCSESTSKVTDASENTFNCVERLEKVGLLNTPNLNAVLALREKTPGELLSCLRSLDTAKRQPTQSMFDNLIKHLPQLDHIASTLRCLPDALIRELKFETIIDNAEQLRSILETLPPNCIDAFTFSATLNIIKNHSAHCLDMKEAMRLCRTVLNREIFSRLLDLTINIQECFAIVQEFKEAGRLTSDVALVLLGNDRNLNLRLQNELKAGATTDRLSYVIKQEQRKAVIFGLHPELGKHGRIYQFFGAKGRDNQLADTKNELKMIFQFI
jgi:hypothetical protein